MPWSVVYYAFINVLPPASEVCGTIFSYIRHYYCTYVASMYVVVVERSSPKSVRTYDGRTGLIFPFRDDSTAVITSPHPPLSFIHFHSF